MKEPVALFATIVTVAATSFGQPTTKAAAAASAPDVPQVEVNPAPPPPGGDTSPANSQRSPAVPQVETQPAPPAAGGSVSGGVAEQGLTNATAAGAARANITGSITSAQLVNINRLYADLNGLRLAAPGAPAAVQQQRQLVDTLEAAPIAPIRPPAASISRLGTVLATVVPTLRLSPSQQRQLAIDVNMALNSAKLTPIQSERVVADARRLLQMNFANNPQGVETIIGELSGMVGEVQGTLAQENSPTMPQTPAARQLAPPAAQTQIGQGAGPEKGQGSGSSPAPAASPNPKQ